MKCLFCGNGWEKSDKFTVVLGKDVCGKCYRELEEMFEEQVLARVRDTPHGYLGVD